MDEPMEEISGENEGTGKERVPILRPIDLPDHCNLPSFLPTRGKKEVCADGSDRQQQRLERLYIQQDKLLREERVVKVNRIAVGEWNQSKQLVEVVIEKGKFWQTMGYHALGKKYLYPEEGLFLLEMNVMELRYGKVPLSVQQAYELMIPYQFSLDHYQVYCHLMRMGYITTRHKECDISDYEYRINLDQFRHRQKQSVKKVQGWFQQMSHTKESASSSTRLEEETSDRDSGHDIKSDTSSDSSASFHGSGVSGKVVDHQSGSSSTIGLMLPGSDMTSYSSDEDKSSTYSDGPVVPMRGGSRGSSNARIINVVEHHYKCISENSTSSSKNKERGTPTNDTAKVNEVSTPMSAEEIVISESRKRKFKDSMLAIVKKEQETVTKMVTMEVGDQLVMGIENQDGPVEQQMVVHDMTGNKKLTEPVVMDRLPIHRKVNKTQSKDDSGKDSGSRRSSEDTSVKNFAENPYLLSVKTDEATRNEDDQSGAKKKKKHCSKSLRLKSSDLGTDLSVLPSSIDIDDVLGILSPSSKNAPSAAADGNLCCNSKYTRWSFQQIDLPDIAKDSGRQLGMPSAEYLPDAIASAVKIDSNLQRTEAQEGSMGGQVSQIDMLQELVKVSQMLQDSSDLMVSTSKMLSMESQEPSTNDATSSATTTQLMNAESMENVRRLFPTKPTASNWGEYNRVTCTSNISHFTGITDLVQSPVAHLWQGEIQPLVRPSEAVSTSYLLHKLQIIRSANLTSPHVRWPYSTKASIDCKIAFDVYQPDSGYKKCKPGQPSFCVVVSSVKEPVPDLATQAYLLRQAGIVKLLWAVVDSNGDIAFYSLQDTEIPPDITMGW